MRNLLVRWLRKPNVQGGLAFACLASAYAFVTPPFRGPDEHNHFMRSYQVSELRFTAHRLASGYSGADLPAALAQLSDALGHHADNRVTPAQLAAARAIELDPAQRVPIEFSNTALYSPLVYLPAAAGISLGRSVGARPLQLTVGRAANVVVCAVLVALAINHLAYARWPALLVVTLPMSVSQMALVTADAFTFAFSFYWIARRRRPRCRRCHCPAAQDIARDRLYGPGAVATAAAVSDAAAADLCGSSSTFRQPPRGIHRMRGHSSRRVERVGPSAVRSRARA
jgi:hypothetical protein